MDIISGGAGNDRILGNGGNDTITGGAGQDTISGGSGSDRIILDQATSANDVHITDYKTSGTDKIALSDAVFTFASGDGSKNGVALTDNTDIFDVGVDFTGGSFDSGSGATFLFDTTDGQLWHDADGNGAGGAVLLATIDNFASYTYAAADFIGWV